MGTRKEKENLESKALVSFPENPQDLATEISAELVPMEPTHLSLQSKSSPITDLAEHRKRVKALYKQSGLMGFSDHRALELLLFYAIPRGDIAKIAKELIHRFGDFPGVLRASYDELIQIKGIADHSATYLNVLLSSYRYFMMKETVNNRPIANWHEAAEVLKPYFLETRNEQIYILCLGANNKYLGVRQVAEGGLLSASVNFRRIATEALALGTMNMFVAHNHVTGSLEPSDADWQATSRIIEILLPLDIYVRDHLIFCRSETISMRQLSRKNRRPIPWPL